MDEDSYPNFGNAYPTASATQTASWHPALRPDSDAGDSEDDFFERYPRATPEKSRLRQTESVDDDRTVSPSNQADLPSTTEQWRRESISVERVVDVKYEKAAYDDVQSMPLHHTEIHGPLEHHHAHDEKEESAHDEDAAIFVSNESARDQEQSLEEQMPDALFDHASQEAEGDKDETDRAVSTNMKEAQSPEEQYEHQGEVTEMEEAQEASVSAPLLDDAAPLPSPGELPVDPVLGTASRTATLGFDGVAVHGQSQLENQPIRAQLDRSFSTNFTEPPDPPPGSQSKHVSDDWPAAGDDKTFGELLDNPESTPFEQMPENVDTYELTEGAVADNDPFLDGDFLQDDDVNKDEDLTAAWQAALDDDDLLIEESNDLDPSKFFGEDDDGFLEDEPPAAALAHGVVTAPSSQYQTSNAQHAPRQAQHSATRPQPFDSGHARSAGTPQTGLYDVYTQQGTIQQPQRPAAVSAQSFADKSKGGYQSPYDLPMEVVKPRRRPQMQQQQQNQSQGPAPVPVPPPRSSSYTSTGGQPSSAPGSVTSLSPPQSSHASGSAVPVPVSTGPASAKAIPKTDSGFFADLPVAAKPRARPSGAYTPHIGQQPGTPTTPSGPLPPLQDPSRHPSGPIKSPQTYDPTLAGTPQQQQPATLGLRQPEKMPLLPDQPTPQPALPSAPQGPPSSMSYSPISQPTAPSGPVTNSRYSPAPTSQPIQPRNRYASAPSAGSIPGLHQAHQFAPRTSSPLAASTDKPHPPLPLDTSKGLPSSPPRLSGARTTSLESTAQSAYAPSEPVFAAIDSGFGAPIPRPRTQSPSTAMKTVAVRSMQTEPRPISAAGMATHDPTPQGDTLFNRAALPHRRQFSREYIFAVPQDERSQDPLQRFKGHPIFVWSANGTVLHSFPKQTPFYTAGQSLPSVKCTPGAITVQDASVFMPMDDRNAKFPGPLTARSKGKKKDVVAWISGKIEDLERDTEGAMLNLSMPLDLKKRTEEKLILWKIMRVFVEHDGVLEGSPKIEEELRKILLPNLAQMSRVADLQSTGTTNTTTDPADRTVIFQLRQALLEGQRERAVWLAEEKKLWGHAMLIASTMGPDTWKQIVQSFVRNQVKSIGSDARSLAAVYQVFAGNSEECVDELVPPSARAGFQMISKTDGAVKGNPLEGLDQWRETLGLVTSNRTSNDGQSLISLGKLLASYGRAEAAHSCYLFARSLVKHSGADDTDAHFVLLGANNSSQSESLGSDLDSILLTEIYEYASSLSAPSTAVSYIPHLQAYKLIHAQTLSACGLKSKAQSYCDHIVSAYTSTTRPSPYYHSTFTQSVADLSALLSQTPHDGKSGFLSKPAMNKVASSAGSWFSKFVAGDDDQQGTRSGAGGPGGDNMAGPFGRVNGDSAEIGRPASAADLYNPMMSGLGPAPLMQPSALQQGFAPSSAPSRYAPSGQVSQDSSRHAPSGQVDQGSSRYAPSQPHNGLGFPAAEAQRPSSARYAPTTSGVTSHPQMLGVPRPEAARATSDYGVAYTPSPEGSRRGSAQDTSSVGSYEPKPLLADEAPFFGYSPPAMTQPAPAAQELELNGLPDSEVSQGQYLSDNGTDSGYEPPTAGYEPPTYSYQPYEPEPDSPEDAPKPKKKMFGDEDDDTEMEKRAASLKMSQADREADDAFKKAAEADAARDKLGGDQKKGWFGGWFGGKKDPNALPGPIKAKLGEENSFYYDENLKKWVNKKGGGEATSSVAATPPPPQGSGRVVSGPPAGPPMRATSAAAPPGVGTMPPTSGSAPPMGGPISNPSSRAGTPASNPASDTSLGAGIALPPLVNGDISGPPSRPSTGLSNASSIDELLAGPPGARKSGTLKSKKRGGRYVDVMAK